MNLIVSILPLRIIQADAPNRVRSLVLEWASQHQQELLEAWNHLSHAEVPAPIQPLK